MDSRSFFNSPAIQRNTPIKRVGLSRKRKSNGSVGALNASIDASSGKSSRLDERSKEANELEMENRKISQSVDYKKKLEVLKSKISEKEKKLKTFQHNNNNNDNDNNNDDNDNKNKNKIIIELEDLIMLWKTGCKNAFLELMLILKDKEPNFSCKDAAKELHIWETIFKHFEQDNDISVFLDGS